MLAPLQWPYAIGDAVAAELYFVEHDRLGVAYTYDDNMGEAGPVGSADGLCCAGWNVPAREFRSVTPAEEYRRVNDGTIAFPWQLLWQVPARSLVAPDLGAKLRRFACD